MRAIKIHGTKKKIQKLVQLSKQALRDGAYRVANRLHAVALNMEGKSAPDISNILKVHRSKISIWLHNWQEEGMDGLLEGNRTGRPPELSETQLHELSDILDSGPVAYGFNSGVWTCPMVTESSRRNSPFLTILPMSLVSSINSDFQCNAPKGLWQRRTKLSSLNGSVTTIPILKKSQKPGSGHPL